MDKDCLGGLSNESETFCMGDNLLERLGDAILSEKHPIRDLPTSNSVDLFEADDGMAYLGSPSQWADICHGGHQSLIIADQQDGRNNAKASSSGVQGDELDQARNNFLRELKKLDIGGHVTECFLDYESKLKRSVQRKNCSRKSKRKFACRGERFSAKQKAILSDVLDKYEYPKASMIDQLAQELERTPEQISTWFNNRRKRRKREPLL